MNPAQKIKSWIRALFAKRGLDAEMDEEMRSHIELRTQANIETGMEPNEAQCAAAREFGWKESVKEKCREQRGVTWIENFVQDARFGIRQLRKNPGFTVVALLSLALGIGAGTAVFSLVNAILLRSLPVPNPQELRVLQWSGADVQMSSFEGNSTQDGNRWTSADCVTHPAFLKLRQQSARQADVFGFCPIHDAGVGVGGRTSVANGMMVSDNFFSGLDVQPCIGRLLGEAEDFSNGMNAVISYGAWEKYFALDPGILGQSIRINGKTHVVVGVLPKGFEGVVPGNPCEFYVAMAPQSPFLYAPPLTSIFHWFVRLMARVRPGESDAQLRSALDVAFANEVGTVMKEPRVLVQYGHGGLALDRNKYGKPLALMLGVVGLVMVVACANLGGLLLVRGAARKHELAVRAALGASRWRLIRQSLTESLTLALFGGALGVLLAIWGRAAISRLLAGSAEGLRYDFSLDVKVLSFSLAVAIVTALLSGLLPALLAGEVDPVNGLRSRIALGASKLTAGRVLVVAQICLALMLLTGAGLYARTLLNLSRIDPGFNVERLLLVNLNIRTGSDGGANPVQFYEQARNSLSALPGVKSAAFVWFPLLANLGWSGGCSIPDRDGGSQAETCRLTVGEGFFETMGIPVLQGRGFEATDTIEAAKAIVVNESFVRHLLPSQNPIGITVSILGANWRIVGVCRDTKYDNIKKDAQPTTYFSFRQMLFSPTLANNLQNASMVVRTTLPPLALSTAVRKAVAQIDPGVAITSITTQEALRDQNISQERLLATLCGFLAVLTMLLACIGLYGLMAYNVARGRKEIAIRMAVGAEPGDVARSVVREALVLAAIGIGAGLPAVAGLTRIIKSQLYGITPNDPSTIIGVVLVLLAVVCLAAWLPARRAARVDPMGALRDE